MRCIFIAIHGPLFYLLANQGSLFLTVDQPQAVSEEVEDSAEETKAPPFSQFSEVFACVPLSKPVEKILIRYDKMPDDFCSVLGFFPSRAESPSPGMRGHESLQRHKTRNANAAFLTLSR